MSSEEGSIGGSSVSDEEYDRRAEILYRSMKEVSANCGKYAIATYLSRFSDLARSRRETFREVIFSICFT